MENVENNRNGLYCSSPSGPVAHLFVFWVLFWAGMKYRSHTSLFMLYFKYFMTINKIYQTFLGDHNCISTVQTWPSSMSYDANQSKLKSSLFFVARLKGSVGNPTIWAHALPMGMAQILDMKYVGSKLAMCVMDWLILMFNWDKWAPTLDTLILN